MAAQRSRGVRTAIRATMAAYIGLKPHMDVVTHHTTIAGDFAMTRSQWLITGQDKDGNPIEVHHHGMEVHRRGEDGTWYFFIDHPFGADPVLGGRASATHRLIRSGSPCLLLRGAASNRRRPLPYVHRPHPTSWP